MRANLALLSALVLLLDQTSTSAPAQAPETHHAGRVRSSGGAAARPEKSTELPVTRVSLYKDGVGFFEHAGRVSGSEAVTIDFTTDQLNDVLQSLTAIDLGGGRIAGAAYNSTTPIEQQLKALPLPLGEDPTSVDFYNAIHGARVEVRSPAGSLSGRVLSFEVRTVAAPGQGGGAGSGSSQGAVSAPAGEKHFLTVASELGVVRTFELTPATEVHLLDGPLRTDVGGADLEVNLPDPDHRPDRRGACGSCWFGTADGDAARLVGGR